MRLESTFANISVEEFLDRITKGHFCWLVKRLSGNDTGITGGHQSGIYVPRQFMQLAVPSIVVTNEYNPTAEVSCYIASHGCLKSGIQAKYYNNKYFPEKGLRKKYDEFRLTRWTGTPIQDAESTGSICILAGSCDRGCSELVGWVSRNEAEEDAIEQWLGKEVEPGQIYSSMADVIADADLLRDLPEAWFRIFPSGHDIFNYVEQAIPQATWTRSIDELLLRRRQREFDIFSVIESHDVMPRIKGGFRTVDEFVQYANSVANRRKSRTGLSLELNLASIFRHEKLKFEMQVVTEQNKRPDFVFPSGSEYHNPEFPSAKLHMLASKTCCKDR